MKKIIEFINEKTNNKFPHIKLKCAEFFAKTKTIVLTIIYRESEKISEEDKKLVENLSKEFLENKVNVKINFLKNYVDENMALKCVKQIIENDFQSLSVMLNLDKTECFCNNESDEFIIKFFVHSNFFGSKNVNDLLTSVKKQMSINSCYNFVFETEAIESLDFKNILEEQEEDIVEIDGKKVVSKNYKNVFPEPFVDVKQIDLFSQDEKIKNVELLNNTFVVFDLETTGLDFSNDKIIEIGAVKIVNGKITEQFSTLINPLTHINDEATKINGITDKMVENAPIFEKVIADFFKFCYGSTIVAHNATFDITFLNTSATKYGYFFDNPQQDTLILARTKLKGLRNYRLSTVSESLSITLNNAHRSMGDASATAKVFIKLMEKE